MELAAGKGILGDCHYGEQEKQIALVSSEIMHWIMAQEDPGLCFSKFHGNIMTQGIDYSLLTAGDILMTDHISIEIIKYSKRCFPECKRVQNHQSCKLRTGTGFAKVLKSGIVQTGDRIWKV